MIEMREFIQQQLDLWDLGSLVKVKGPDVTNKPGEEYYELVVVYRTDSNAHHFEDGYININIGYQRKGGYWNRRCIRRRIAEEGKKVLETKRAAVVWSSSQKALEAGPSARNEGGAFAL